MHPSAPGYLHTLRQLVEQLFDIICHEFAADVPVTVRFDRVDDLAGQPIQEKHLVATALLCAQLLHRVTARPDEAQPRHVQTLTDILEQVIPTLASVRPHTSPATTEELVSLAEGLANAAFRLVLLADPADTGYDTE